MIFGVAVHCLLHEAKARSPEPITVAVGSTGYLDERFVPDKSVSWGIDRFNRPFVTLCLGWKDEEGRERCAVNTIFQRYADDPSVWVRARNMGGDPFSGGEMKTAEIVLLIALIKNDRAFVLRDEVWLVEPEKIKREFTWDGRLRAKDDEPGVAVHTDRPDIIVHDAATPLGRHPSREDKS